MKNNISFKYFRLNRSATYFAFVCALFMPDILQAQGDGARFYWKGLMGTNAVPLVFSGLGGNSNPMDPTHAIIPGSDFRASMAMVGYAKMLPIFKRSAMISAVVPMGRLTSDVTVNALNFKSTARGYGDPTLAFDINIIGPKPNMSIPDILRYEPGFSVDLVASIAIPIGEYNHETPINIGQNRWYGRIGAPIVWQLGPWVPGRRTTLELLPAIWLYGDNNNFVGQTMKTDPMFQVEGHLTRDFTEGLWGSFDVISYSGGKPTIGIKEGNSLSNTGLGATLGYHVNENMQLMLSYSSTINDKAEEDLKMDGFRVTLLYGWHKMVEGIKRMKSQSE